MVQKVLDALLITLYALGIGFIAGMIGLLFRCGVEKIVFGIKKIFRGDLK